MEGASGQPARVGIAFVFVFCGSLIGGGIVTLVGLSWALLTSPGDAGWGSLLLYLPMVIGPSLLLGLPYATLAGVTYGYLPPKWRQPWLAAPLGAASVLLVHLGYGLLGADFGLAVVAALAAVGAVASYLCARIVRGLDGRRHPSSG
jgi:hypothetical protein